MTPYISIITVNYNNAVGLKKTMESVLNQSYDNYEYIVVDGDSTDGSKDVLNSFDNSDLIAVSERDTGIYNAMNKGIRKARGTYVLFLNSGDHFHSEKVLEEAVPHLEKETSFVGFDLILDKDSGQEIKTHPEKIALSYLLTRTVYHPSTFIRRELFDKYGMYNEDLKVVSDWEFFLKTIGFNSESFLRVPVPITVFDMHGISSNTDNLQDIRKEKEGVLDHYLGAMQHSELDKYLLEQLQRPSKRVKHLVRLEKSPFLRKIATGFLGLLNAFNSKK